MIEPNCILLARRPNVRLREGRGGGSQSYLDEDLIHFHSNLSFPIEVDILPPNVFFIELHLYGAPIVHILSKRIR